MSNNAAADQIAFNKGQKDGIVGTAKVFLSVLNNTDKGDKNLVNPDLNKIRKAFISWRDFLIAGTESKKAVTADDFKAVLLNTDKILS